MTKSSVKLSHSREKFPIRGEFRISRGVKTVAEVIVCTIESDNHVGRGECVPYARYDETLHSVSAELDNIDATDLGMLSEQIHSLHPGAARNALDCAMWDLKAKTKNRSVEQQICHSPARPVDTAVTLSLDAPEKMADAARAVASRSIIKIKLGGDDDIACMHAVVGNAPKSRIIIDANEGWTADRFPAMMREAARLKIALIEQPLPADHDRYLLEVPHPVPICADESVHTSDDVQSLTGRYDYVNIKLDKTGGLTEALNMQRQARELGFGIMVGCMVGSSLAMAPAVLLAQDADYVDLDGPLLLSKDRSPALHYYGSTVSPPERSLWG
ncbi:MAG: N-acetyl-D-Glu racemase DgcA [Pseudomonadota bacterium]